MSNGKTSAWSPFRIPVFRVLWIATLASNIGTWMHDIGAGWLMTSLSPSPVMGALVQTATTLPIFLLAMPAGALSDIIDRRRYLIVVQVWMALVASVLGMLTLSGITTAWTLVALTFAMDVGTAMMMPAWTAVTPELVPRDQLQLAIALNSLGINVARAIGPALAGIIVSFAGTGAVFVINAISFLGVILIDRQMLKNNVVALAKAAKAFSVPTTITTVETESFSGHTLSSSIFKQDIGSSEKRLVIKFKGEQV